MAKKTSVYSNVELDQVKEGLIRNVEYLSTIDINTLEDDYKIMADFKGSPVIRITTKLEEKLDSYIVLIKDSIEQLHSIMRIEAKVTPEMGDLLDKLEVHMKEIEEYYNNRPPSTVVDREIFTTEFVERKNKKTGETFSVAVDVTALAANIPTQIKHGSKVQKIILGLLPIINDLREGRKDPKLLRGGQDLSPAMAFRLYQREKQALNQE